MFLLSCYLEDIKFAPGENVSNTAVQRSVLHGTGEMSSVPKTGREMAHVSGEMTVPRCR